MEANRYYAKVRNESNFPVSSSLPYNCLGPGKWATKIQPMGTSNIYPINSDSAASLMNLGIMPEVKTRQDGSTFLLFEIVERD